MKFKNITIHSISWIGLPMFLITGIIFPWAGAVAIICMAAPVFFAFSKGRYWCGNICPRGSFLDKFLKFIPKKPLPKFLNSSLSRWIFFTALMSSFTLQILISNGTPGSIGTVFVRMVLVTTLFALILGMLYGSRSWCAVCPMGTLSNLISRQDQSRSRAPMIMFKNDSCASCNLCGKSCPMKIRVLDHQIKGKIDHPDCIKCSRCASICPKEILQGV